MSINNISNYSAAGLVSTSAVNIYIKDSLNISMRGVIPIPPNQELINTGGLGYAWTPRADILGAAIPRFAGRLGVAIAAPILLTSTTYAPLTVHKSAGAANINTDGGNDHIRIQTEEQGIFIAFFKYAVANIPHGSCYEFIIQKRIGPAADWVSLGFSGTACTIITHAVESPAVNAVPTTGNQTITISAPLNTRNVPPLDIYLRVMYRKVEPTSADVNLLTENTSITLLKLSD